jgi:hypothetical protein
MVIMNFRKNGVELIQPKHIAHPCDRHTVFFLGKNNRKIVALELKGSRFRECRKCHFIVEIINQ